MNWCAERGAVGSGLTVSETKFGRGVSATRTIAVGEAVLQIPLSLGLLDVVAEHPEAAREAVATAPWFARLACRLLQERALGEASEWCLYLPLLPVRVSGSPLVDTAMMEALKRYPPLHKEAQELLVSVHAAHAQLLATSGGQAALCGGSKEEFTATCAVVFSRSYGLSANGRALARVLLPLADLLNHGGDECGETGPTWPPVLDRGNMRWEVEDDTLVVRSIATLSEGEEALFSYREQSNDTFQLYYGFFPALNPHDDVVLFDSVQEVCAWHGSRCGGSLPEGAEAAAVAAAAAVEAELATSGDKALVDKEQRLKVAAGGRLDRRLVAALAAIHAEGRAGAFAALAARCEELCARFAPLEGGEASVERLLDHKRRILLETVESLQSCA